jgi:hypothetical protein
MNNDDSDTETRNEKKPPKCRKPKNDLIKIKKKASKKPKAEFDSLTFVEGKTEKSHLILVKLN